MKDARPGHPRRDLLVNQFPVGQMVVIPPHQQVQIGNRSVKDIDSYLAFHFSEMQ
jgi:hypothetical protein